MVIAQVTFHFDENKQKLTIGADLLRREDAREEEYQMAKNVEEYVKSLVNIIVKSGAKKIMEEIIEDKK